MFGFSIGKLAVLVAILVVVIYGYKLLTRLNAPQRKPADDTASASRIDTIYDPETDTYVPRGTVNKSDKD